MAKPKWKRIFGHAMLFLAVIGPGLITAIADNDAGGVGTYTVAAALYGMASQYLIVPTTILLAITQEVGARLAIVSGKGLGGLIRERYGVRISLFVFVLYFVVNQGVVLQNVSGLKSAMQLFQFPWQIGLIMACLLLILLVIFLNFKKLQRIFLIMVLFYVVYIISAILVHPNWAQAFHDSFIFPSHVNVWNLGYWFSLIAVLGTTVTAWGQFFISSYIVDKGLIVKDLKSNRVEVYTGAVITNGLSWMIAIAVTYTLFIHGIHVTDGYTAALAIKPFAGQFSSLLFAIGLFGASILGLTIVPLATSYVFTEMFGYERTLNVGFRSGKIFYIFFIVQILFGLIITIFPNVNLFRLTLYADYLNGAILPLIFYFLITFARDKDIMGKYRIGNFTMWFLRVAALVIFLAVAITFVGHVM